MVVSSQAPATSKNDSEFVCHGIIDLCDLAIEIDVK
jgi:hypothetical protein